MIYFHDIHGTDNLAKLNRCKTLNCPLYLLKWAHYAMRYISNGLIHVQRSFREFCVCIKQVLIGWKLIFGYKVQWQQANCTVEQLTNQTLGDVLYHQSDTRRHPPSLIRVFAVFMKKHWVLHYLLSAQQSLIDWADAQADLSLHWVQRSFCWFCLETADFMMKIWPQKCSCRLWARVRALHCLAQRPWLQMTGASLT